jgi:hypothetical protein
MIWVTWRQQRLEALILGAILALVGVIVLKTGLDMIGSFRRLGVAACITAPVNDQRCGDILSLFHQQFDPLNTVFDAFELLPVALALLLAAPFVLDLEQGTYRLVWTQSITRRRWLMVRAGLLGLAAVLASLAGSLLMTWWHGPLDQLSGVAFSNFSFDTQGSVPLAYTLFALALALTLGTLLRRAVPAMALTLVGFATVRTGIEVLARPRYLAPIDKVWTAGPLPVGPHDWVLSKGEIYRNNLGRLFSWDQVDQLCGHPFTASNLSPSAAKDAYIACFNRNGLSEIVRYQPADRYWLFQGIESVIFLGLAAGLFALTAWWVRYRLT